MKNPIRYLLLMTLFAGCGTDEKEKAIPVYAFDQEIESGPLKLSELMDNIHIVRLETSPEVQLPEFFRVALTDNAIITIDQTNIRRFSRDGKFEKVLARRGGGPLEYQDVFTFTMDQKNEVLYIFDPGSMAFIRGLNLKTGELSVKIPLPIKEIGMERFELTQLMSVGDSTLVCFPAIADSIPNKVFFISTSGRLLGTAIPSMEEEGKNTNSIMRQSFSQMATWKSGDNVYAVGLFSDTVFLVSPSDSHPVAVLKRDHPFLPENMNGQYNGGVRETSKGYLYTQNSIAIKPMERGYTFADSKSDNYYIDKSNSKITKVSGLEIDLLDFAVTERVSRLVTQDNEGIWSITAPDFLVKADSVIQENTADPEVLERVKSLSADLKETDNPILLIGTLK